MQQYEPFQRLCENLKTNRSFKDDERRQLELKMRNLTSVFDNYLDFQKRLKDYFDTLVIAAGTNM